MDKNLEEKPKHHTVDFQFKYEDGRVVEYQGYNIDFFRGIAEGKFSDNSGEETVEGLFKIV